MKLLATACGLVLLCGGALQAQRQRDFLTDDEIDQIRIAQEPNERIASYLKFARLRLELVRQSLAEEKPGRTKIIHNNLEDYTRIIEALDTVIDDALARKVDLAKSIAAVAEQEKEFLALLEDFSARRSKDFHLYQFVLQDAREATQDSLEESQHDLRARTERVLQEDVQEKKKREAAMGTAELEQRKVEEKKTEEKTKKAPTLRRKGETPKPDR